MLFLKTGVRITGMVPGEPPCGGCRDEVYKAAGHDLTITACVDGKHTAGSLHYAGAAMDLRTCDLPPADVPKILAQIRDCVGGDFDVLREVDHITHGVPAQGAADGVIPSGCHRDAHEYPAAGTPLLMVARYPSTCPRKRAAEG